MPSDRTDRKVRHSRILVIDASVVRAAGSLEAVHPLPSQCRDILRTILDVCHRIHLSEALRDEWSRHTSKFSRTWLKSMYARRKVISGDIAALAGFAAAIENARYLSDSERAAMEKDRHLVDGAAASDKIILSLDDTTGRILHRIVPHFGGLADFLWVKPTEHFDAVKAWLEERGTTRAEWLLRQEEGRPQGRKGRRVSRL